MESTLEDDLFCFDTSNQFSDASSNVVGRQKKEIRMIKKRILATHALLEKYKKRGELLKETQEKFDMLNIENKMVRKEAQDSCKNIESIQEKYANLEKEMSQYQHKCKMLEEEKVRSESREAAAQSYTEQLKQLLKERENKIDSLKCEITLANDTNKGCQMRTFRLKKAVDALKRNLCNVADVVFTKRNLTKKEKLTLYKYMKMRKQIEKGGESTIPEEEELDSDDETIVNEEITLSDIEDTVENIGKIEILDSGKDSNVYDSDNASERISEDTGRGTSLACSDSDKCFQSPEYSLDSPVGIDLLSNKANGMDTATNTTINLKQTKDIATSPIIFENAPTKNRTPQKSIIKNDQNSKSAPNDLNYIPDIVVSNDICIDGIEPLTPGQQSESIARSHNLFEENSNDGEIEMILHDMRMGRNLLTPIPPTPARSLRTQSRLNLEQNIDETAQMRKDIDELKTAMMSITPFAQFVQSIIGNDQEVVNMLKNYLQQKIKKNVETEMPQTFNDDSEDDAATLILDESFDGDSTRLRDNLSDSLVHNTHSIEEEISEATNTLCNNEKSLITNDEQEVEATDCIILPIAHNNSKLSDKLQFVDDLASTIAPSSSNLDGNDDFVNNNDHSQTYVDKKMSKRKKLTILDKLRKNYLPKSKIKNFDAPLPRKLRSRKVIPVSNQKEKLSKALNSKEAYEKAVKVMAEVKLKQNASAKTTKELNKTSSQKSFNKILEKCSKKVCGTTDKQITPINRRDSQEKYIDSNKEVTSDELNKTSNIRETRNRRKSRENENISLAQSIRETRSRRTSTENEENLSPVKSIRETRSRNKSITSKTNSLQNIKETKSTKKYLGNEENNCLSNNTRETGNKRKSVESEENNNENLRETRSKRKAPKSEEHIFTDKHKRETQSRRKSIEFEDSNSSDYIRETRTRRKSAKSEENIISGLNKNENSTASLNTTTPEKVILNEKDIVGSKENLNKNLSRNINDCSIISRRDSLLPGSDLEDINKISVTATKTDCKQNRRISIRCERNVPENSLDRDGANNNISRRKSLIPEIESVKITNYSKHPSFSLDKHMVVVINRSLDKKDKTIENNKNNETEILKEKSNLKQTEKCTDIEQKKQGSRNQPKEDNLLESTETRVLRKSLRRCSVEDNKDVQKPIGNEGSSNIISYSDLELFDNEPPQKKRRCSNGKTEDSRKLKNPQHSILCKMIDKYGINIMKNQPPKMADAVLNAVHKKIEKGIAHILELPSTENNKNEMNKFIDEIQKWKFDEFLSGLIMYLKDPERKIELFSKVTVPPAPAMTKSEQVLLYLVTRLQGAWHDVNVVKSVLQQIEYTLFKLNGTPEFDAIESMSHFYAILCRYIAAKSRLRLFMLDAMYCINYKSVPLIKQCLEVWMHILPLAHMGIAKSPLVTSIVYLLHFFKSKDDKFHRVQEIRNILAKKYFFNITEWNETKILEMFKNAILEVKDSPIERKMLRLALIILGKRQGPRWCQNKLITNILLPLMSKENVPENTKVFCVSVLGPLLKPYPVDMKVHCEIIMNQLIDMLNANPSSKMQEAIYTSLINISKHNQNRVLEALLMWQPEELSPEMEKALEYFVREKPVKVWKTILMNVSFE